VTRPADATIPEARSLAFLFHGQLLHAVILVLLVGVAYALAAPGIGGTWFGSGDDTVLGVTVTGWFWLNIILVVVHQTVVALVFRVQLGWGLLTRWFGRLDLVVWGILFMPLLLGRPLVVGALAAADSGSMALPRGLALALGWILLVPVFYALWSVARYFGIARALGGDHFRVDYREMPIVREGAFAWTPNAMYLIVFLGLSAIAFLYGSRIALVGALFQHAYIWVHYWFTEKPDMDLIYSQ
jgi:hypothetical protein